MERMAERAETRADVLFSVIKEKKRGRKRESRAGRADSNRNESVSFRSLRVGERTSSRTREEFQEETLRGSG
ncbi:MAG: hypothetical protein D6679_08305 [Candidatus Hydrogenedentota bacterium]|nr:MAG: hypothetical protein D6679_08305 [Candidatus Hydrogenedentota bacterium]